MIKLICAPMATLSHEAFRRTVERFGGCDEYFTEMINAPSLLNMGPFEKYYLQNDCAHDRIVWQLTGTSAEPLAKAATMVAQLGGIGVDLNMGCSAPQIYKTGAGISWMLKPLSETANAVRLVKKALDENEKNTGTKSRLSVKCRLGGEDYTDEGFFRFCDMLVEEGVELITLHARTIKEKHRMRPRYEYVEKLKQRYNNSVQVYLNGDITDEASADFALEKAPSADGIMIARQAAVEPWIFYKLSKHFSQSESDESVIGTDKTIGTEQLIDMEQLALNFIEDVKKFQPKEFFKTRTQRFFSYYCDNFKFGHYFKMQMLNAKNEEDCINRVKDFFKQEENERFMTI